MKILAIWITKGLFIFVICIVEWNICSNLKHIINPSDMNDFGELIVTGVIQNSMGTVVKNTPIPKHDGLFFSMNQIQIVYDGWDDIYYIRSIWGTWSEWRKIILS